MRLRIGSRKSPLAQAQARQTVAELVAAHPDVDVEWVWITTSGDRFRDRSLAAIGGKGLFLKEIEEALLAGTIDLAIHSGKDVPAMVAPGLTLAATPRRASPWDVLCAAPGVTVDTILAGGRIGTGSTRRTAQLRYWAPQARIVPIRGNVETRLNKVMAGELDAVVLAAAGLERLNVAWTGAITPLTWMVPAVGQGTLALETRADDVAVRERLAAIHDAATWTAFLAERAVLAALGGDCFTPLGAYATLEGDEVLLRAGLWPTGGGPGCMLERRAPAAAAVDLGSELGQALLEASRTWA